MQLCILYNRDQDLLDDDPGREAREDVTRVATALTEALETQGYRVEQVGVGADPLAALDTVRRRAPDLVINLCESVAADSRGEMVIPCLLELLGLAYTGSSSLALGLALHKNKAKDVLRSSGISTPESRMVARPEDVLTVDLPFPLIVKPAREDGSVGVDFDSVVQDRTELGAAVRRILERFRQPALVEQFVPGREIYVPILGNRPRRALQLTEIQFGTAFRDRPKILSYRAKWEAGSDEFRDSPSQRCALEPELEQRVVDTALAAFTALECQDYGRVDLRLDAAGRPFVIDINPNCDLHPQAGFAQSAAAVGIGYPALARRLVEIALERCHGNPSHHASGPGPTRRAARADRNVFAARSGLRPRARRPRHSAK
ncbi:MAG TPA: D-alanine--D-alanine ligase [Myxococcaceae bacterium]|jgi:D-alanine-D-alanine ligase|nr:D-alanine--D-alanine ligase [Myxococcaceae bacterium]